MSVTVLTIALIRLIPYILGAIYAWRKGYKWLTAACVFVSVLAVSNYIFDFRSDVSAALASIFAFLLLMHAIDLPRKKEPTN